MGQIIGVTGHTPHPKEEIENIVRAESGTLGDKDIWQQDQIIVVGRKDFDEAYLKHSIEIGLRYGFTCDYLTQEDFLFFWDYNWKRPYFRGDPRIWRHEGLSYLSSIGFKWPSTDAIPGSRSLSSDDTAHWRGKHPLTSRFGYNVRKGTPVSKRRVVLKAAIRPFPDGLGLKPVAYHLAFLINMGKRRYDSRMDDAVTRWESDLDWLYKTYYINSAYSFNWPPIEN